MLTAHRHEHYPADVLLVHSGNRIDVVDRPTARFPSTQVPVVRARVARVLDAFRPSDVVSAAAAGADLIVLEEAIHRGINAHVVLPIAAEEFVNQSVSDAGAEWVSRFRAVLQHVSNSNGCSLLQGDEASDEAWYLAGHDQILTRAETVAGGEAIVALTVRPPEGEIPPSVTDRFAMRAERMGLLELCIDPRPGSSAAVMLSRGVPGVADEDPQ